MQSLYLNQRKAELFLALLMIGLQIQKSPKLLLKQ